MSTKFSATCIKSLKNICGSARFIASLGRYKLRIRGSWPTPPPPTGPETKPPGGKAPGKCPLQAWAHIAGWAQDPEAGTPERWWPSLAPSCSPQSRRWWVLPPSLALLSNTLAGASHQAWSLASRNSEKVSRVSTRGRWSSHGGTLITYEKGIRNVLSSPNAWKKF